jgi:hypothetical protein
MQKCGPNGPFFELNFYFFVNFRIYLFSYINKSSIEILKRFAFKAYNWDYDCPLFVLQFRVSLY